MLISHSAFSAGQGDPGGRGVVVASVEEASAAVGAGIRPGDILLAWERAAHPPANPEAASGSFDTPFDFLDARYGQGPRGPVTLLGLRAGEGFSWEIRPESWGIVVRPHFTAADLESYRALFEAPGCLGSALDVKALRAFVGEMRDREGEADATWLLCRGGRFLADGGRLEEAGAVFTAAKASAGEIDNPSLRAWVYEEIGEAYRAGKESDRAAEALRRSLEIREKAADDLLVARSLELLGLVEWHRDERDAWVGAEDLFMRCLRLRESHSPGGLEVAATLEHLGGVAWDRADLEKAQEYYRRSYDIRAERIPGSLGEAASLGHLGGVAWRRGDLGEAERCVRRALKISKKLSPGSRDVYLCLKRLGILAKTRGDLEKAEGRYREALEIVENLSPGSTDVSAALYSLGNVESIRGNLDKAEEYRLGALEIQERLAPGSRPVAMSLESLGIDAWWRGDLEKAEQYAGRALELYRQWAPDGLEAAGCLATLGSVASSAGDLDGAESRYRRSLAIYESKAPGTRGNAACLGGLGGVASDRGDLERAERYGREALAIWEKIEPGSYREARAHHFLGTVLRRRGSGSEALARFLKAVDAIESQIGKLGGSGETQSSFRAGYIDYYRDAIGLLIQMGRDAEAMGMLERSRARQLLSMMAERDLMFTEDLPGDLDTRRRMLGVAYKKARTALGNASVEDEDRIRALRFDLDEVMRKQAELKKEIKRTSPRFASLRYPEPLGLVEARRVLDSGTLALTWSLGEEGGTLFMLTIDGLETAAVDMKREALGRKVRMIRNRMTGLETSMMDEEFSARLLGPARDAIGKADRLLIIPDGPLHYLPFGALPDPLDPERYLIERLPIHIAVSLTVYAELKKGGGRERQTRIAAFGDPLYMKPARCDSDGSGLSPALRGAVRSGLDLTPLPSTRLEVESIKRLFPENARLMMGVDATEAQAKQLCADISIVHFACHGITDERFPLNSALALTPPETLDEGEEDGLLQAWEVFESMRIDADLLVLSACETALGQEMGGEGIVGLTRSFQYAGARSIVASLWPVADLTTAEFMKRFYRRLKDGMTKDEALRRTQMDFIGGSVEVAGADAGVRKIDASRPFYWAAFELIGDWE